MQKGVLLFIVLIVVKSCALGQSSKASIKQLKDHAYVLCSDSLQGRATGTIGQKKAAAYLISKFKEYGLSSTQNNDYKHKYTLIRKHNNTIAVKSENTILFSPWHFLFTSGYNQNSHIKTNLFFAGYGSENEISKSTVNKNAIAFLSYSPKQAYQTIQKIKLKHNITNYFVIIPKKSKELNQAWKANFLNAKFKLPQLFYKNQNLLVKEEWAKPKDSVNIFYCFNNALKNVLNQSDSVLVALANSTVPAEVLNGISTNIECSINYSDSSEMVEAENIAGFIYGQNTDQTIVVTAHYDHLGTEGSDIYYGADDNASGTSVLLELARLLAEQNKKEPLKRSILFLAFSGEELGLYGSEAYVNSPLVSLDSTIININLDMVGRNDKKHNKNKSYMYLLNAGLGHRKYYSLGKKDIELPKGFKVSKNPGRYEKDVFTSGSDHYSFYKRNVPISVIFTGLHDDYHTPADTPNKLNYRNMVDITEMLFQYISKIANSPEKYPVRFKN